jgi:non-homologous end joining protein Ku
MPSRPSWQGYLKVSLVTCPVKLYRAATDTPGVSFHLLDAKTHRRIHMKPVDPGRGEVERAGEQRDNVVPLRRPTHAKHRAAKKPSRQRRRHG